MKRLFLLILAAALFIIIVHVKPDAKEKPYQFENAFNDSCEKAVKINKYQFVSRIYENFFYHLQLIDKFSLEEKIDIMKALYLNLSDKYPFTLIIKNYQDRKDLLIAIRIHPENKTGIPVFVMTNYDLKNKKMITKEEELNNAYASLYYLAGDRFVHYSQYKIDARALEKEGPNNIADIYIFDEKPENDAAAQDMLLKHLGELKDDREKYIPLMTLCQYYLTVQNYAKADETLKEAKKLLYKNKNDNWNIIYTITIDEYAIVKAVCAGK
jgi:hypothetical protein